MNKTAEKQEMAIVPAKETDNLVPTFATTMESVKERLDLLQAFVKQYMKQDEDFGVIPGTGKKPTLLKPGAEKLCDVYGFSKHFDVVNRIEDWEKGFFHYEVKCTLISKKSNFVEAEGLGSCNNKESKYSYNWVSKKNLPSGIDVTKLKTREKTGQYGPYTEYRVDNPDPYNLVNTILKMAKKRALIDAVLSATRSSGLFTQDVEDIIDTEPAPARNVKNKAQSGNKASGKQEAKPAGAKKDGFVESVKQEIRVLVESGFLNEKEIAEARKELQTAIRSKNKSEIGKVREKYRALAKKKEDELTENVAEVFDGEVLEPEEAAV